MNLSVAILRRAALPGALALLLGLTPSSGHALPAATGALADSTEEPPVPPMPPAADSLAKPAAADSLATPAAADSAAKPPGDLRPVPAAAAPAPAVQTDAGQKGRKAKPAKAQKPPREPKAAKVAKVKEPKPAKVKPPQKSYEERRKEDGVYARGANWLSLRFGYAKRAEDLSGQGLVGYGVGYQRMLSRRYAFAAGVGHDVVGHYGSQIDEAIPFTGEFQRHFLWKSAMRPYLGLGGGYYLRKTYRTAYEYTTKPTGGGHVSLGFLSPVTDRHVVGFEARMALVQGQPDVVNPTFGPGVGTETIWTAKVSWALVY